MDTRSTSADRREPANDLLRLFLDCVTDYAIFLLDTEGYVISWNPGAARLKGYRADEIIGRHFSSFYAPEDLATGKPARGLATARDTGRFEDEGWRLRQDGSRFWASVLITAIRDEHGELRAFGKVTRDMTSRRETELARLQLAETEAVQRATETSNRSRDAFLASVAHQLNTPVTNLKGWAQLARKRAAAGRTLPPELLATLEQQTTRLASVVAELLDLSRLDMERLELHCEHLPIRALVRDVAAVVQRLTRRHVIEVAPGPPLTVYADEERLRLVLMSLLTNAVKYSPAGGDVIITVAQQESPEPETVVSVRDFGLGVAPEFQEAIFERYRRGPLELERGYDGLGVGLYVSRAVVERHGGRLWCESVPGHGSVFTFTLPTAA